MYALVTRALSWKQLRYAHHFIVMSPLATTTVYYYSFAKGASLLLSSVAGMLSGAIPLGRCCAPSGRRFGVLCGFVGVLMIARPWNGAVASVDLRSVAYMVAGSLSVGCSFVYA